MPECWDKIKHNFKKPNKIIHIIGTNGKGSTGRFLAYYLYKMGFDVGHYTSPHIQKFNERIWINGQNVSDEKLEEAHNFLQNTISKKYIQSLSYFEYTTILAMRCFGLCDYVILEAGLGGERDATSVFERDMTLVTTIDYDHQSFLGETIKEIATTKLNSIKNKAIIGKQHHNQVYELTKKYPFYLDYFDNYEIQKIRNFIKTNGFASFLVDNLALAMSYIVEEGLEFSLEYLDGVRLFGRMEKIDKNLYIDVGHNPLAARAIAEELKNKNINKIDLVYNTYKDKNYKEILAILKPFLDKVFIIEVNNDRIIQANMLIEDLRGMGIDVEKFDKIRKNKITLVFGSFSVVERFLSER